MVPSLDSLSLIAELGNIHLNSRKLLFGYIKNDWKSGTSYTQMHKAKLRNAARKRNKRSGKAHKESEEQTK